MTMRPEERLKLYNELMVNVRDMRAMLLSLIEDTQGLPAEAPPPDNPKQQNGKEPVFTFSHLEKGLTPSTAETSTLVWFTNRSVKSPTDFRKKPEFSSLIALSDLRLYERGVIDAPTAQGKLIPGVSWKGDK